jgi:hypothetical protein
MELVRLSSIAPCAVFAIAACSSSTQHSGGHDAAVDSGGTDTDLRGTDGAADFGDRDAAASPSPSCQPGDRQEWSGGLPSTTLTVAVCSLCGQSYVVAANQGATMGQLTVENGSQTVTANVPAGGTATTTPLADNPADGTISVCGTTGAKGCLATAPQNQRYCNPYRDVASLNPERIDQGVDFGGAGSLYALGPGTIDLFDNRNNAGWPGGTFASYLLTAGPASGKTIYIAENIDLNPSLKKGSVVFNGTVLGTIVNASPDTESGWGVAGAGYTAEHSCYTEGCMTPLGVNFNQLIVCLNAPSGLMGTGGCCPAATGWPTDWCSLLAAWQ